MKPTIRKIWHTHDEIPEDGRIIVVAKNEICVETHSSMYYHLHKDEIWKWAYINDILDEGWCNVNYSLTEKDKTSWAK